MGPCHTHRFLPTGPAGTGRRRQDGQRAPDKHARSDLQWEGRPHRASPRTATPRAHTSTRQCVALHTGDRIPRCDLCFPAGHLSVPPPQVGVHLASPPRGSPTGSCRLPHNHHGACWAPTTARWDKVASTSQRRGYRPQRLRWADAQDGHRDPHPVVCTAGGPLPPSVGWTECCLRSQQNTPGDRCGSCD